MAVLFLIVFIGLLGFGITIPLFPFYAQRFGASPEVITWTMAVFTIGQMVATPFWGRLGDAVGRRPVLVLTLLGISASYVMLAWADSLALVIASRVLGGLMAGNISAAFAYVADVTTPEQRAGALGRISAGLGLGFMLGPALGGVLAGPEVATANYVLPALAAAALSFVAMLATLLFLPESLAPEHRRPWGRAGQLPRAAGGVGRPGGVRGDFLRLVAAAALFHVAMSTMESVFSLWANDVFRLGPSSIGVVFFVMGGIQAFIQGALMGVLTRRVGEKRVALGSGILLVLGLGVLAAATARWHLWLGVVVFSLGVGLMGPALSSLVSRTAGPSEHGSVMGWFQSAGAVGRIIGPGLSGILYAQAGFAAPFAFAAAIMVPVVFVVQGFRSAAAGAKGERGS